MADRIVDLLTLAGVLALVALPVAVIVIGVLVWINRRRARAIKDWAARHGDLKRRLADVEAIRPRAPLPPEGWELIMEAAETFRTYEAHHRAKASEAGRPEKAERNREMAEKLEGLLARCPGLIRTRPRQPAPGVYREDQGRCEVPPAGWDCTRAPGHDGPCAAVPSMIREHLGDIVKPGEPLRPIYGRPVHGGYPG